MAELKAILNIALPTLVIQLGFVVPPILTASYVGRFFGPVYLDGYQMAYLTVNLFTLSLLSGLFSASDTLSPQAFGSGNYREVGVIALRAFIGSLALVLPICSVLVFCMDDLLVAMGEDPEASRHAADWYRVYAIALPFFALYMAIWKFLSAQNVMMPLVVASVFSTGIVLPLAMHVLVYRMGFIGSAVAFATYQICQPVTLLIILGLYQPYREECWPGLSDVWKDVFHWKPFRQFLYLGAGGIVASSEWIYWESISLGIGTLGVIPLSVHTVPSQFLTIAFMVSFGIGVSLSIRLGHILPISVCRAKNVVWGTAIVSCSMFAIMSVALYHYCRFIYSIFTNDSQVVAGCEQIWWKVCVYFFLVSWFALSTGIANGLGMQWTLGMLTIFFLWVIGVPGLFYYGLWSYQSLSVVWSWIDPPYIFINLALLYAFISADWDDISIQIRKREGVDLLHVDHVGPYGITYGSVEEERPLFVDAARHKNKEQDEP